jgi:pimeloyl-ACP methyl ester carboxylesterase
VDWLFTALYETPAIPYLPALIAHLHVGDSSILSRLYATVAEPREESLGMRYSVECGEDGAFTSLQETTTDAEGLPPEARVVVDQEAQATFSTCQFWGVQPVPAAQKQPVTSAISTLILAGEYDPITPPANDLLAQQTLSNSYLFQFPGTGHGVLFTNPCPEHIVQAFQDQPATQPDGSCIASMTEPDFQIF